MLRSLCLVLPLLATASAFAATGTLASVNKGEGTVSLIDVATGQTRAKLTVGSNPQEVVFSPDGKTGVVSNMGASAQNPGTTLSVIDLPGKKIAKTIDLGAHGMPHGLVFWDKERVLVTSHVSDSLLVVNLTSGKTEKVIPTGGKGSHLVLLSADKKMAYTVNVFTADVSVIDLAAGKSTHQIKCGLRAEGISTSPDGLWMAVGNVGANTVTIIDLKKKEVKQTLEGTGQPIRTFFTSDSKTLLVSCAATGEVKTFDTKTWKEGKSIDLKGRKDLPFAGAPHPIPMNFERHAKAKLIYVVVINSDKVAVIDEKTLAITGTLATGKLPDGIGFSPVTVA